MDESLCSSTQDCTDELIRSISLSVCLSVCLPPSLDLGLLLLLLLDFVDACLIAVMDAARWATYSQPGAEMTLPATPWKRGKQTGGDDETRGAPAFRFSPGFPSFLWARTAAVGHSPFCWRGGSTYPGYEFAGLPSFTSAIWTQTNKNR